MENIYGFIANILDLFLKCSDSLGYHITILPISDHFPIIQALTWTRCLFPLHLFTSQLHTNSNRSYILFLLSDEKKSSNSFI